MKSFFHRNKSQPMPFAGFLIGLCFLTVQLLAGPVFAADPIYVDADASGANDGSSWTDAYTSLAVALHAADSGDEIWVAEGKYQPTEGTDRTVSFVLKNGVALYGGFAGGEPSKEERDPSAHPTVLTGDLSGNDVVAEDGTVTGNGENSYCVVTSEELDATAILDGFTVTAGNNDDCGYGGGMINWYSNPLVTNCTFSGNSSGFYGGGMYNVHSSPSLSNCTFSDNSAKATGGGMYNQWDSCPTVVNCMFSGNEAGEGGGGMLNNQASPTVSNCTFSENSAGKDGGGIFNGTSNPIVSNCTFSGNSAGEGGGGMFNSASHPVVSNCTFSGNSADEGGGLFNSVSSPTVVNCTFCGNGSRSAGGMYNVYISHPQVINSIFWGDAGGEIVTESTESEPTLANCVVQGGNSNIGSYTNLWGGIPVISADPCLGGLADNEGPTRTCMLLPGSSAIDAGLASFDIGGDDPDRGNVVPSADQRGIHRPKGLGVDIGAYESVPLIFVDGGATGADDGSSWTDAFTSLDDALELAGTGGQVWVAKGTYSPGFDPDGNDSPADARTKTFVLKRGVALYGGFAGGETERDRRNPGRNVTILTGDLSGNDVVAEDGTVSNNRENSYHVVYSKGVDDATILDGFTVIGGNADGDESFNMSGGGMYNEQSSPTVTNCTFSRNMAENLGGGMFNDQSSPVLSNCTFSRNSASCGGGMENYDDSSPALLNCTFSQNRTKYYGGGICNDLHSGPVLSNCTFSGNSADSSGGGMYNYINSSPTVTNCVFWDDGGGEIYSVGGSTLTLAYCVVRGGDVGDDFILSGDIPILTEDPRLGTLGDNGGQVRTCALLTGSSALDSGLAVDAVSTDQRGVARPQGPGFDIGAYEVDRWYAVTVSADLGGTVSAEPWGVIGTSAGFTVFDTPTFVVTPEESMDLTGVWLDGASQNFDSRGASVTVAPLSADRLLEVTFDVRALTITATAGAGGTVSPESASVTWGQDQTVTFTPYHGYAVADVTVDGVSKGASASFAFSNVQSAHTLHVTFAPDEALLDQGGIEGLDFGDGGGAFGLLSGGGASVDLPAGTTADSFVEVASPDLGGFWLEPVGSGDVQMQVARAVPGGTFLWGVSFDVEASTVGGVGLLPVSLELVVSEDLLSTECLEAIADGEGTVGLVAAFLSRVAVLKIVSGDAYDLFEAALDSGHEDPIEFFSVRRDGSGNLLMGVAFLIADASAAGVPAVQAIPASDDCRFLVFDGAADGHYRDPLVAVERGTGGSGGSGGCSALSLSGLALLMLPLLGLLKK